MAREKRYALKLTRGQLGTLQRLLESAASNGSTQQVKELEPIDSGIYSLLFPELCSNNGKPPRLRAAQDNRPHPMPLRHMLRVVRE